MGHHSKRPPHADAPPQEISPHLTLQPPLCRRGHGPGLILVVDHYALLDKSEKSLDPPPLQKWAEEGFAVVQIQVPGNADDGGEFPLQMAVDVLNGCEGCDNEGAGFGLVCMFEFCFFIVSFFFIIIYFFSFGLEWGGFRSG